MENSNFVHVCVLLTVVTENVRAPAERLNVSNASKVSRVVVRVFEYQPHGNVFDPNDACSLTISILEVHAL